MDIRHSERYIQWISQFAVADQKYAEMLVNRMKFVNRDRMHDGIVKLILKRFKQTKTPIAMYAEAEISRINRKVVQIYNVIKTENKTLRAVGDNINTKFYSKLSKETGSEGIIRQLVTEFCRDNADKYLLLPGPDVIRVHMSHNFAIVTDFIGSGKRIISMLDSAWSVETVKSWKSRRQISFHVFAYSSTEDGHKLISKHKSKPEVHYIEPCPTIFSINDDEFQIGILELCAKYDPFNNNDGEAIGYKKTGALLAFAHGCPNNCPRILWKNTKSWRALFPKGVTTFAGADTSVTSDHISLKQRLSTLGQQKLSEVDWNFHGTETGKIVILTLAAISRGPRFDIALSQNTGLTLPELNDMLIFLQDGGWIDSARRLTDMGSRELSHAKKLARVVKPLPKSVEEMYIPSSMRVPVEV